MEELYILLMNAVLQWIKHIQAYSMQ